MQRCPQAGCHRAGDDLGSCGFHVTGCPNPVEVKPTDTIVTCARCKITRAFDAPSLMNAKGQLVFGCQSDKEHCQATFVAPKASKKAAEA